MKFVNTAQCGIIDCERWFECIAGYVICEKIMI